MSKKVASRRSKAINHDDLNEFEDRLRGVENSLTSVTTNLQAITSEIGRNQEDTSRALHELRDQIKDTSLATEQFLRNHGRISPQHIFGAVAIMLSTVGILLTIGGLAFRPYLVDLENVEKDLAFQKDQISRVGETRWTDENQNHFEERLEINLNHRDDLLKEYLESLNSTLLWRVKTLEGQNARIQATGRD